MVQTCGRREKRKGGKGRLDIMEELKPTRLGIWEKEKNQVTKNCTLLFLPPTDRIFLVEKQ